MWQAALDKDKNLEDTVDGVLSAEDMNHGSESVESVASQMNELTVNENPTTVTPPSESIECLNTGGAAPDIDKRIRALKKKVWILMLLCSLGILITDFFNIILSPTNCFTN